MSEIFSKQINLNSFDSDENCLCIGQVHDEYITDWILAFNMKGEYEAVLWI